MTAQSELNYLIELRRGLMAQLRATEQRITELKEQAEKEKQAQSVGPQETKIVTPSQNKNVV